MSHLIDIHGSCVSAGIVDFGEKEGFCQENIYCFRQCMPCDVLPHLELPQVPEELFPKETFPQVAYTNQYFRHSFQKDSLSRLLSSESRFLMVDLFDLCQNVVFFQNSSFPSHDNLFFTSEYYKEHSNLFKTLSFFQMKSKEWYRYIDHFMEFVCKKYDKVILNKLTCNNTYLSLQHTMHPMPQERFLFGNAAYNPQFHAVEEHISQHFPVTVLDYSKFFSSYETFTIKGRVFPSPAPVHFEPLYYQAGAAALKQIIQGESRSIYRALPFDVIATLLQQPMSTEEYSTYHQCKTSPFHGINLLNSLFMPISLDHLLEERFALSGIYSSASRSFPPFSTTTLPQWISFFTQHSTHPSPFVASLFQSGLHCVTTFQTLSLEALLELYHKTEEKTALWYLLLAFLDLNWFNHPEVVALVASYDQ